MNTQLNHIFDVSACLTRRQVKDYVSGSMIKEECHALEHHITSCPFCSEAIEGYQAHTAAAEAAQHINASFLTAHFQSISPQIHLNGVGSSVSRHRRSGVQPLWYTTAILLLLGLGIMWFMESHKTKSSQVKAIQNDMISQQVTASQSLQDQSMPASVDKHMIAAVTTKK